MYFWKVEIFSFQASKNVQKLNSLVKMREGGNVQKLNSLVKMGEGEGEGEGGGGSRGSN